MSPRSHKVALYLRVSTAGQTIVNQRRELLAVAKRHRWTVVAQYVDEGISGAKGGDVRAGYAGLLRGVSRREFGMVMAWSVDRLGRSLQGLLAFLLELQAKDVDLYLHQQGLDTSTPAGRAMFQLLGVFAEFERAIMVERVKAGHARARAEGKRLGRPKISAEREKRVIAFLDRGYGIGRAARAANVGVSAVQRLNKERKKRG